MIVLMDIGNTRAKYCLVENGKRTVAKAISNTLLSSAFLTEQFLQATKFLVASVNHPQLTENINHWCREHNIIYQQVISEGQKNNVISAYKEPSKLGVDRWLALIGASQALPEQNILIIDSGTATTFDLLTADGQHQGGWILAGIDMLITSILANTIQVYANDEAQDSIAFGVNTSENVHHAAWAATVGAVQMAISQSKRQHIVIDEIVLTGGNAQQLSTLMDQQHIVIDDLVFIGLNVYNQSEESHDLSKKTTNK